MLLKNHPSLILLKPAILFIFLYVIYIFVGCAMPPAELPALSRIFLNLLDALATFSYKSTAGTGFCSIAAKYAFAIFTVAKGSIIALFKAHTTRAINRKPKKPISKELANRVKETIYKIIFNTHSIRTVLTAPMPIAFQF